jgi:hypothetical protein
VNQAQAQQLTQTIKAQFSHVETGVVQAQGQAQKWFVAVWRHGVPPESQALILYNENDWRDALTAFAILSK